MDFFSVIIPLKDEEKSIPILYKELAQVLNNLNKPYELIFVDDGSEDDSFKILEVLQRKNEKIKVIKLRANFGKSYALSKGLAIASGKTIITLDADLQDDPKE